MISASPDTSSAQDFWLDRLGHADNFNRWVFSSFEPWIQGSVLEVGCGTGNFTALIAEASPSVMGVDIDPRYVEAARTAVSRFPNVRIAQMDVTSAGIQDAFDTIVLLDVLEHIEDDIGLLRSLGGRLRPGGRVILKVPAVPALYSTMDEAVGHFRRYSASSLQATLTRAGFKIETIRPINALGLLGWWLNGKVMKRTTPPAAQIGVFNRLIPLMASIERTVRLPFGLSFLAFATHRSDGQ